MSLRIILLLAALLLVARAGPSSAFEETFDTGSIEGSETPAGTVYVFRAMGGNLATPEMDKLAAKVRAKGIAAEVHGYIDWIGPANAALKRYKEEAVKSPIIAVGHSAGGDSAIRFATWLKRAGVPVDLVISIDPTRIVGRVPGNVERFVNIYCSSNALGGGDPKPARDFHGHFASVDLKNYPNVWHVYLPRITGLQDKVVAKIVEVVGRPDVGEAAAVGIEYKMPRGEALELWDSGVAVVSGEGDTPASIAEKYGLPAWVLAEVNGIDPSTALPAGQQIVVPRRLEEDSGKERRASAKP